MSEHMSESNPADEPDTMQARLRHPSGVLYLMGNEGASILLDALLDLPPGREFNKTEFADFAGVTRQTVANYIELLQEVEIVEPVPNASPQRYRLAESDVVEELSELNSAINAVSEQAPSDG